MTNEQESAAEQQPVLHLPRQPEASQGPGSWARHGEHHMLCKAGSSISHCPADGGNSPALEEGQREEFWKMGSSRAQDFV